MQYYWYVMQHPDPPIIERLLQAENSERFRQQEPTFLYIVPFCYLKRATTERGLENEEDQVAAERKRKDVRDNNELRSCLHSFVFIKSTKKDIERLVRCEWNNEGRCHLRHYQTRSGTPIRISEEEMRPLIRLFVEQHQRYSFVPYREDTFSAEQVRIKTGLFKGYKASVLEVRHTDKGANLTLGISIFNNEVTLELFDYPVAEVDVPCQMKHLFEPYFIRTVEDDLFQILRRRVLPRNTEETQLQDQERLNSYSILNYLKFENTALRNHFLALMLLCASLRNDRETKQMLLPVVQGLAGSADNPANDEEAFLLALLFVATKDVAYRRTARAYCQTHEVASESLRKLMPLVKRIKLR